jgi:hypothetical protein
MNEEPSPLAPLPQAGEGSGASLPEGTEVTVVVAAAPQITVAREQKRVELPLFDSDEPGTLDLTNERIAEIFEEEDIASYRSSLGESSEGGSS